MRMAQPKKLRLIRNTMAEAMNAIMDFAVSMDYVNKMARELAKAIDRQIIRDLRK